MIALREGSVSLLREFYIKSLKGISHKEFVLNFDTPVTDSSLRQRITAKLGSFPAVVKADCTDKHASVVLNRKRSWSMLQRQLEQAVYDLVEPDVAHSVQELKDRIGQLRTKSSSFHEDAVKLIIASVVNPALATHAGSCSLSHVVLKTKVWATQDTGSSSPVKGVEAYLNLHGQCSGCSKSQETMRLFIETELAKYLRCPVVVYENVAASSTTDG